MVSYDNGQETGRDVLQTAGGTAALAMSADRPVIAGDGDDLAFVTIRALDGDGIHVFDETGEVAVKVLKVYLAPIVDNPMVSAMQGMSLKKIFSMSRMAAPEGLGRALSEARIPSA